MEIANSTVPRLPTDSAGQGEVLLVYQSRYYDLKILAKMLGKGERTREG